MSKSAGDRTSCCSISEVHDFDLEEERGVGRNDSACAGRAVSVVGRASQLGLLALLELADSLIPASDDLADADLEREGLSAGSTRVENAAVLELSDVVD